MRNGRVRKRENGLRGAVVLLQFEGLGGGIGALEVENILDLRPAPAVDGLVVVAHDKEVAVHARKELHDVELHGVGVLKLVDVDIAELARKVLPRFLVGREQGARLGEKVVKVERVVAL